MFQAFPVKNPTFGDAPLPNVPGDGTQQVPPPYGTADNAPRLMPAMNFADPSMSPNMNMNMPPNMNMSMNMTTNMSPDVAANMAAATMTAMASMMNQFVPTSFAVPTNQPVFAEQFCVQNATGMELVVLPVNQQAQVNCLCAFDVLGQMWFRY